MIFTDCSEFQSYFTCLVIKQNPDKARLVIIGSLVLSLHDVTFEKDGALRSIGELSSTLSASSLENLSAVSGSHSLAEAVFFLSLAFFRLICSYHRGIPPLY